MEFISAKTILSGYRENNPWFGVNYNMNIYKGCCHGCIYCDSRSECYRVEDFDRVRVKKDALITIERELASKRKKGVIGTGAMSDPYNPFEEELGLTRQALSLIDAYGFGASVCTKSDMITRDADVLCNIGKHSPVLVKITITAADDALSRKIEPMAPESSRRFAAVKTLAQNGIFAGILLMPVLPFIGDSEDNILRIVRQAALSGARFIYPAFGVTLRQNQRDWFYKKLDALFPGLKEKYLQHFGGEYACTSPRAHLLWEVFRKECEKLGILFRMNDIVNGYQKNYKQNQLSFFKEG